MIYSVIMLRGHIMKSSVSEEFRFVPIIYPYNQANAIYIYGSKDMNTQER